MQTPQTYYPRESPVHRMDARVKLALVLVYSIALFVAGTWPALGALALLLAVVLVVSRLPLGTLAKSLVPFYVLMAFALVFNMLAFNPQGVVDAAGAASAAGVADAAVAAAGTASAAGVTDAAAAGAAGAPVAGAAGTVSAAGVTDAAAGGAGAAPAAPAYGADAPAGLLEGAAPIALGAGWFFLPDGLARTGFYCLRILCLVLASLVLAYSTRATELAAAITWLLRPLARPLRAIGLSTSDIAAVLTLVLRFIPLAFEQLGHLQKAQMARGAAFGVGGLWRRVSAWQPVMIPWLASLYRQAGRIAVAMDVRCYGAVEPRSALAVAHCRPADWAALLVGAALCAALAAGL